MTKIKEKDREIYLAAISAAKVILEGLKTESIISEKEFNDAIYPLNYYEMNLNKPDPGIDISSNILSKLYLHAKKQKHPERFRFNPFIMEHKEFDEFFAHVINKSKENPEQSYIYQCMVNGGHSTMIEIRIVNGKKNSNIH